MSELTKAQVEVLSLHLGTSKAEPRRVQLTGYFRKFAFPTHPTAMALYRRGMLDYRGYDGKTRGGWFITDAGRAALTDAHGGKS